MSEDTAVRTLPAVGRLLEDPALAPLISRLGRGLVTSLLREEIEKAREELLSGKGRGDAPGAEELAKAVEAQASTLLRHSPRRVINATGVIAHTNLGRSVLSKDAAARVAEAATGYLDLEYDLPTGKRGERVSHVAPLLRRLFPGHAALAVNNNAAAIFLTLRALAKGKEVVVSRGELVEIGGSFRVSEILAASGAKMVEVGTTNRTRPADYEAALGARSGLILKVHASNFKVVGFTEEATVGELAAVCRARQVPLAVDWGSGDLVDLAPMGIHDEIPVSRILDEGADVVTFSGDKLLGGPQAGIIVGRPDLLKRIAKDPIARAVRLDRLQIAALRETLSAYVRGKEKEEVPTVRMLTMTKDEIARRAADLIASVRAKSPGIAATPIDGVSRPGGGSSPVGELPTTLVAIDHPSGDAAAFEKALRRGDPPVIARILDGRLLLDMRTVLPDQDEALARRVVEACVTR